MKNTKKKKKYSKKIRGGMVGLEDSVSPTTGIYSHTTDYNGMFKELIDKISELESLYNGGWVEWQEITDEIDELGRLIDRFSGEPMSVTVTQRRDERTTLKNRSRKRSFSIC